MTDVVIDTLRLRGSHATRLARVAARALPAALERALADVDDREVASVRVVLDLDPTAYDDETLAVLWADLIRAEVLARPRKDSSAEAPRRADRPADLSSREVDLAATARAWLRLVMADDGAGTVPAALLALGDPEIAGQVAADLGADVWAALVAALRGALRPRTGADPEAADPATDRDLAQPHRGTTDPAGDVGRADDVQPPAGATGTGPSGTSPTEPAAQPRLPQEDVLDVVQVLRELRAGDPAPFDPATITRAAGLVLLYPWLADHCRRAEELHPGLDALDVREAALAALLDDPASVDDPLVRLLAGRPDPFATEARDRFDLPRADEVVDSARGVLASFAALLPGFERSSPAFVRDAWVVRLGVLDPDRDPMTLTAASHPLDVLLPLLPYPLGLFKLPWTVPLTVRFRP